MFKFLILSYIKINVDWEVGIKIKFEIFVAVTDS